MSEMHTENAANQRALILNYLKTHRGITHDEANDAFGCARLSARIYDFRKLGYDVSVIIEHGVNRFGRPTRYARYFVTKKPQ